MSKIKMAKAPKCPKKAKPVNMAKLTRAEKKLEKQRVKRKKELNKKLDRSIGIIAIIFALLSGGLDVVKKKMGREK